MMSSQEILATLLEYRTKLADVLGIDAGNISISSEYSFITVNIAENGKPAINFRFQIADRSVKIYSIHCDDKSTEADVNSKLLSTNWPGFQKNSTPLPWSTDITQQLEAIDNIASLALNCTAGDDYHPGNFSKILLTSTSIELQQINYMKAKSLDHKNDYSLRSLVFRLPLSGNGKLITEFNDRSSDNNRHCGDRIKAALDWLPH